MKTLVIIALAALSMSGASAQETIILRGPPRPEPRAGGGAWGGPEPVASNVVVVTEQCKTPWELISEHPLLSGVARAVKKSNDTALMNLLNDPQAPITVLAPDNEALASAAKALGIPLSAALNGSEPVVAAILRSHVLNTTKPLSALGPDSTVTSFSGVPVRVFSPTLIAEKKNNKKNASAVAPVDDAVAPAPASPPLAEKSKSNKDAKSKDMAPATANPAEPVPRRRSMSRRSLSQATYTNSNLNTPDPSVGGSAIVSSVVDVLNGMLSGGGGNNTGSSNATASGGNSTGSGVSPVDALLNSFISLFAGIMGGGGDGNSTSAGGLFGPMMGGGMMGNGNGNGGMKGWKVTKRRGCAGGCSHARDWTFAPLGKTAASSLPDNSTYAVLRNATVEAGNVRTCGGFLHVVDGVIVPEVLSKKEKGKGDSKSVALELGDGDGAVVSRITVPLDRAMVLVDDSSDAAPTDAPKQARANITVEYLGKVAKNLAKKNKEESDAKKKKTAAAASPAPAPAAASPAPAPAVAAKDDAPSPAPEVSQASVKKDAAPKQKQPAAAAAAAPAAAEPPEAVAGGETIAPKGAKQPSA